MARTDRPVRKIEPAEEPVRAARTSSMDVATLREVVELLEKSDVTLLTWRRGDERLLVRRGQPAPRPVTMAAVTPLAPVAQLSPLAAVSAPASPAVASPPAAPAGATSAKVHVVTSPFVGTFYRAPSPEAPPFVELGQTVQKGQVLCIVEAMKLMNEIESEASGKVVEILGQNGHPVEFGQALFKIEAA